MRFEEIASDAGKQATRVGQQTERPAFSRLLAQRRRRNLISAWSISAAVVSIAVIGLVWPTPGISDSLATSPTLTGVPASCPVTVPGENAFTPASESPEDPPEVYEDVWFGTPDLWTLVNPAGEVWSDLPGAADGTMTEQTFWWSENYTPDDPGEVTVTAEQLDGTAHRVEASETAGSGFDPFMTQAMHVTVVGLDLPDSGCWQVTANYKGATVSYVVWVDEGEQVDYETYSEGGNVWIVSDCPNTDQVLKGFPDGLPFAGEIKTREEIEAWLGTGGNSKVVPRNGEAWDRNPDGSIFTVEVEDFMIEVTIDDVSACPSMPTVNNGVPVIYRIESAP